MLYIQTESGLQSLNPSLTKEKIISILGYTPADKNDLPNITEDQSGKINIVDEEGNIILTIDNEGLKTLDAILDGQSVVSHMNNTIIHVTAAEKEKWNNTQDFSGKYDDLIDAPILNDNEGNMIVADEQGNIIMKVDNQGLETTTIIVDDIVAKNSDEFSIMDEQGNIILRVDENGLETTNVKAQNIDSHINNTDIHITATERTTWNNKSDFDGKFNSLAESPFTEDNSGELVYTDTNGNIIVKISEDGLTSTTITADGVNLGQTLITHINETNNSDKLHITTAERKNWNNKSNFNGKFSSLTESPFTEDESGKLTITDNSGNIVFEINSNGNGSTNLYSLEFQGKSFVPLFHTISGNIQNITLQD